MADLRLGPSPKTLAHEIGKLVVTSDAGEVFLIDIHLGTARRVTLDERQDEAKDPGSVGDGKPQDQPAESAAPTSRPAAVRSDFPTAGSYGLVDKLW